MRRSRSTALNARCVSRPQIVLAPAELSVTGRRHPGADELRDHAVFDPRRRPAGAGRGCDPLSHPRPAACRCERGGAARLTSQKTFAAARGRGPSAECRVAADARTRSTTAHAATGGTSPGPVRPRGIGSGIAVRAAAGRSAALGGGVAGSVLAHARAAPAAVPPRRSVPAGRGEYVGSARNAPTCHAQGARGVERLGPRPRDAGRRRASRCSAISPTRNSPTPARRRRSRAATASSSSTPTARTASSPTTRSSTRSACARCSST